MRFQGKTAIVTGAAAGSGRAVAQRLAREGARLMLGDRNAEGLAEVAAGLDECVGTTVFDVADPAACAALVDATVAETGRLDILCNSAGILRLSPLDQQTPEVWSQTIGINLGGVFHMSRAAMPHLVQSRGCIVNLSSSTGLVGMAFNAAYCASKHGVIGLTRALALEFSKAGVRVNAVCPTGVKTPMIDVLPAEGIDWAMLSCTEPWLNGGELCEPEDVADAVAFLASDEAKRITGVALPVDGGQTAN